MYDYSHQYTATVVVNDKTEADEYYHTDGNTYIEARKGSEYTLVLNNGTGERVLMVPAIDGLSVIDGQPAGLDSPGYVVEPFQAVRITGWLKNNTQVARFVFWDKDNSYSNKTGRGTANTGVIGVLVFRERPKPVAFPKTISWSDTTRSGGWSTSAGGGTFSASAMPISANYTADVQEAGTGHGRLEAFSTQETAFEKRDPKHPDAQIVLYYDTSKGLERRGIQLRYKASYAPDPFPTAPNYVKNSR